MYDSRGEFYLNHSCCWLSVVRRPYERIKRPLRTVRESLTSKQLNHFLLSLQCLEPSLGPELKRGVNVFKKFKRCEHFLPPGSSVLLTSCPVCLAAGQAEAELKDFSPYFKGQYSAARFAQVEEDLEPNKEKITQLLKQKVHDPTLSPCPSSPARPTPYCPVPIALCSTGGNGLMSPCSLTTVTAGMVEDSDTAKENYSKQNKLNP